jgi:hypothetical protein
MTGLEFVGLPHIEELGGAYLLACLLRFHGAKLTRSV